MAHHFDKVRGAILDAALPHVPFDGWTRETLRHAAKEAHVEQGLAELAFPDESMSLVDFFATEMDRKMLAALDAADTTSMRIRDRIIAGVRLRLEALEPYREAERRDSTYADPHLKPSLRLHYGVSISIWQFTYIRRTGPILFHLSQKGMSS